MSRNGIFSGNFSLVIATYKSKKIPKGKWEAVPIESQPKWQYKRKFKKAMVMHTSKQSPKSIWRIFPLKRSSIKLDGCLRQRNGCYWAHRKRVSGRNKIFHTQTKRSCCVLQHMLSVLWLHVTAAKTTWHYYCTKLWNISFVMPLCRIAKNQSKLKQWLRRNCHECHTCLQGPAHIPPWT